MLLLVLENMLLWTWKSSSRSGTTQWVRDTFQGAAVTQVADGAGANVSA